MENKHVGALVSHTVGDWEAPTKNVLVLLLLLVVVVLLGHSATIVGHGRTPTMIGSCCWDWETPLPIPDCRHACHEILVHEKVIPFSLTPAVGTCTAPTLVQVRATPASKYLHLGMLPRYHLLIGTA